MFPIPSVFIGAALRWLWRNLDGEAAVKTSRLCIFAILIAMSVSAYWASSTRTHIERRLDDLADQRREYDRKAAVFAAALDWLRTDQQRQGDDIFRLTDRMAHAEGQLAERGRP